MSIRTWLHRITAPPRRPTLPVSAEMLESFEEAFSSGGGGCVRDCVCGLTYYDPDGGWTWADGELESLNANPKARPLGDTVRTLVFEGREYVMDCACWHAKAARIIHWLRAHGHGVAEFLRLEKQRRRAEADDLPEVTSF